MFGLLSNSNDILRSKKMKIFQMLLTMIYILSVVCHGNRQSDLQPRIYRKHFQNKRTIRGGRKKKRD